MSKIYLLSIFLILTIFAKSQELEYKMITAAAKGDKQTIKDCLNKGAKINAKNKARWTALGYAVRYKHKDIVEYLISKGADVNKTVNTGNSPLYVALMTNNIPMADYLISKGAIIDKKDYSGMTTLAWAAKYNNIAVVKYLVEKGSDINAKNTNARTVLDVSSLGIVKNYLRSHGAKTSQELLKQ